MQYIWSDKRGQTTSGEQPAVREICWRQKSGFSSCHWCNLISVLCVSTSQQRYWTSRQPPTTNVHYTRTVTI